MRRKRFSIRLNILLSLSILICLLVINGFSVAQADTYEPDNSMDDAKWISIGTSFQDHDIDPANDYDWVKFGAVGVIREWQT